MKASTALFVMFEQAGFRLVRCTGHAIWACPCGHTLITSSATPGKGRSMANAQAQIARTLRRCDAPLLTLRTDRDWIADVVRFVANRRRGALAGRP